MHHDAIDILGVRVDNVTMDDAVEQARLFLEGERPALVVTVNPEFVLEAQKNETFRAVLNGADLAIPDGIGLVWASRSAKAPLREHVTGADFVLHLLALAEQRGSRVFLFGAGAGVAKTAAAAARRRFLKLNIVGAENELTEQGGTLNEKEVVERINMAAPDILLVAFGAPKQELWLAQHLPHLPSVRLGIGVGGTFDYLAGTKRRAPALLRTLGLEWFWRLLLQPSRWKRIVTATIRFPLAVMRTPNAIRSHRPS